MANRKGTILQNGPEHSTETYLVYAPHYQLAQECSNPMLQAMYVGMTPLLGALQNDYELNRGVEWLDPGEPDKKALPMVHTSEYVRRCQVISDTHPEIGLAMFEVALSPGLHSFCLSAVTGTVLAAQTAVTTGQSVCNLVGGFHHAFADHGSGFCVYNDIAVAARHVVAGKLADRVLVIDCDVHQGDGTAAIFAGDERVFTFSIHNEQNFPAIKQESDIDIPLRAGTGTELYLSSLESGLSWIPNEPFGLIIYQAGIDIHEGDQLGGLRVSADGVSKRDKMVRDFAETRHAPMVVVPGGGYGRDVHVMLDIRYETLRTVLLPGGQP